MAKKIQDIMKKERLNSCKVSVQIDEQGNHKVISASDNCRAILDKINPIRGTFWKLRMTDKVKRKLNLI